jgi:hypothetical protein
MHKTVLLSGVLAVGLFLFLATGVFGGIEPSPFRPSLRDLRSFRQEIDPSKGRLAEAKPGANLAKPGLLKSQANMTNLLQSIRAKVKGLLETKGQSKGVIGICEQMQPKLDSLELLLKNFGAALKRGDKPVAQGLLSEIEETVKALEALIM